MQSEWDVFFIDGEWRPRSPEAGTITVVSASTEDEVGSVPIAGASDIDAAVGAARRAFDDPSGWSSWSPQRRADVMLELARQLEHRADNIAHMVSLQNGMPIKLSRSAEARTAPALLRYYAELIGATDFEERRSGNGRTTLVRREPLGVVAAVVPWNFPQGIAFMKLAPILAAGCTAVLKPAAETVLDAYVVAQCLAESGLPPGVLNIICGGRDVGAALVTHPGIDKVAFTGSTAGGLAVATSCARLLRPVTLELGGKSAAILLEDANLDTVADEFLFATMRNNGQTCYLSTRILVPRRRYAELVDNITDRVRNQVVGDALDVTTEIGPLVSRAQRDRVENYINRGIAEGGRVTTGGGRPKDRDRGWFVEPTVFADVDNDATIAREEIFGPVLAAIAYADEQDAVRLANDSAYGLGGSVWSADEDHAIDVARRIRTGTVGINSYRSDVGAPFGGVKASGIGRELGPEGLANYLEFKSIYLDPNGSSR